MKTEFKLKVLALFSFVCLLALVAQAYFLWSLNQRLTVAEADGPEIPESIEERLQATLGAPGTSRDPLDVDDFFGQAFASDPFAHMQQMQQQMDRLFNSFSASGPSGSGGRSYSVASPLFDFRETATEYQVHIQTPPDHDLEISSNLETNLLTVSGMLTRNMTNNTNSIASSFTSRSQFSRSFDLSKPIDELGLVTEQQVDGLLIRIPKK